MMTAYVARNKKLKKEDVSGVLPADVVWVDLLDPTREDEVLVEKTLKLGVPTREEMQEIEISSRLYKEEDALFMTAILLWRTDTEAPEASPVTFILTGHCLITVRYSDPKSFHIFATKAQKSSEHLSGESLLVGLLETLVDRLADILEHVSADVNAISEDVFSRQQKSSPRERGDFKAIMLSIGQREELNSKARESLVSFGRLLSFLGNAFDSSKTVSRDLKGRVKTLVYDIHSLTDHASFLSNKINFLLDATLGMINIEQNAIIKIVSVAAVVFLPPTLVASIYGMNFAFMPELKWLLGYPLALILMILSAIVPFWYFKRRGWL